MIPIRGSCYIKDKNAKNTYIMETFQIQTLNSNFILIWN